MMVAEENVRKDRFADIGRDTAALLHHGSVLPCLTFALLFCMLIVGAVYSLMAFAAYIAGVLVSSVLAAVIAEIVLVAVGLFLVLSTLMPLWLAKLRMAGLLWQDVEPMPQEIFYYFASFSRYRRAWRTGAVALLLLALPVGAVVGLFAGAFRFYSAVLSVYLSAPLAVLLLIALCVIALAVSVSVLFFGGVYIAFAAIAVGNEQLRLREALALAVKAGKRHLGKIFRFSVKSLLWLALSLLTVGVLFILWFSHYYNLSYMRLSMVLCLKEEV